MTAGTGGLIRVLEPSGHVRTVPLERYVASVVGAEMWVGPRASPDLVRRALELQAILSRTFAVASRGRHWNEGADLCTTTHCQVRRESASQGGIDAAAATVGQILIHGGRPALTLFHADCGGATSDADAVWGGDARPYLIGRPDAACLRDAEAPWEARLEAAALVRALDVAPRLRVDGRLDGIRVLEVDGAGRARLIRLSGAAAPVVRGEEFRMRILQAFGGRTLRSTRFSVTREGSRFVFRGTGFGHGAGLCQHGAIARLRDGASVLDVLTFYYPGTSVTGS